MRELLPFRFFWVKDPEGAWRLLLAQLLTSYIYLNIQCREKAWETNLIQLPEFWFFIFCLFFPVQEGEEFVKKIGGIFAFKVKNGPEGKEATWVVDVKNGKGSVLPNSGQCNNDFINRRLEQIHKGKWGSALVFSKRAGFRGIGPC